MGRQASGRPEKEVRERTRSSRCSAPGSEGFYRVGQPRPEERPFRRTWSLGVGSASRGAQRASHPGEGRRRSGDLYRGSHLSYGGGCALDRRLQDQPPRRRGPRGLSRQRARALPRAARALRGCARRPPRVAGALLPAARGVARMGARVAMDGAIALALLSSAFLGTAVVLANVGLRYLHPARGALVSIPSTTLAYWLLSPFLLHEQGWNATAFAIYAAVGVVFPAVVTLLNFASNRIAGPTMAGTLSSTTPLFAVLFAIVALGEPLTVTAAVGTAAIVLGVIAFTGRGEGGARALTTLAIVLPLAGAAIRG